MGIVVKAHKEILSSEFKTMSGRAIAALIHTHYKNVAEFARTHKLQRQSVYTWLNEGYMPLDTVAPFFADLFKVPLAVLNYYQCAIVNKGKIESYKKILQEHKAVLGAYADYVLEGKEPDPKKCWEHYMSNATKHYGASC